MMPHGANFCSLDSITLLLSYLGVQTIICYSESVLRHHYAGIIRVCLAGARLILYHGTSACCFIQVMTTTHTARAVKALV